MKLQRVLVAGFCRLVLWRASSPGLPVLLALMLGSATAATAAPAANYTNAQAAAGQTIFARQCAICHGASLQGKAGPALAGQQFLSVSQYQELTADYLYRFMVKQMPANAPGSLSKTQVLKRSGLHSEGERISRRPTPTQRRRPGVEPNQNRADGKTTGKQCKGGSAINRRKANLVSSGLLASVFYTGVGLTLAAAQTTPPSQPPRATASGSFQTQGATKANGNITDQQRLAADQDQDNWLLYGRTYDNQRFSPVKQITADNVKDLQPVAIIQTGVAGSFETNPIVYNGVMFISTPYDHVIAYDAVSGKRLWSYAPELGYTQLCCGPESRGVAVADGSVYIAQLNGQLVSLNSSDGKVRWTTKIGDPRDAFSLTMAPQIYDGMVIVGTSGAEFPTRSFVGAYDAKTGKQIWRFYTTAAPGEPGGNTWSGDSWKTGGGSMWNTPAIDPQRGLIIFATGNPNPDNYGDGRKGDNAYTDSIVAIHAKTGKLAWWCQQVAHDLWDYDADAPVVLLNVKDQNGQMVPAAAEAGKEGQVFIVNRDNGHLIRKSDPFVEQSEFDVDAAANQRLRQYLSGRARRQRMVAGSLLAGHASVLSPGHQ